MKVVELPSALWDFVAIDRKVQEKGREQVLDKPSDILLQLFRVRQINHNPPVVNDTSFSSSPSEGSRLVSYALMLRRGCRFSNSVVVSIRWRIVSFCNVRLKRLK